MHPDEIPVWRPFLKRVPLFQDLSEEDLERIAQLLKPLSLPRGATVFQQGDPGDAFYIVTSGQVRLLTERQGRQVVTGFLGRGDVLGEHSVLTGEPRPMTARLDSTSEFLVLSKKDFGSVLRDSPSIALQLSRTLSARLLRETRGFEEAQALQPKLLALLCGLDDADRTPLALAFAHALREQSRQRVLLVDMDPKGGSLAGALGLEPKVVTESMLQGLDLHDPRLLESFVQVHASGLGVLTVPSSVLGGRLFRSVFLFINLLREHSGFGVVCLGGTIGDVEKSVLNEADRWLLAGAQARKDEFLRLRSELGRFVPEPKSLLELWLGEGGPDETPDPDRESVRIPWSAELRSGGVFEAMGRNPRSRSAVERLARRVAGLRVGLAMGTGAALGFSLVGVLKAFEKEHIPVDIVAGTSMGSVIGGLYALGMSPVEIERIVVGIDKAWVWENLFWDLTVPRSGLFAGTTLLRFLRSYFGTKEFRDLELPYACVATDIETGAEVLLQDGPVAEAVRASCGIPLIFQPFEHRGRFLVDGGLVSPNPVRALSQMGADILLAVNLTMPAGARKSTLRERRAHLPLPEGWASPHMMQVFFQMIYTMEYEIAKAGAPLAHITIHPDLSRFAWTELHRGRELIEAGERVVEEVLPKIKAMLPYFSDSCRVALGRGPW
ncbi:MAG: patatin-like phospholipase family protein [Elusimicrobiota bacterium]